MVAFDDAGGCPGVITTPLPPCGTETSPLSGGGCCCCGCDDGWPAGLSCACAAPGAQRPATASSAARHGLGDVPRWQRDLNDALRISLGERSSSSPASDA